MTDPQRVGVNLLWLVPGVVGGSEEYTVRPSTACSTWPRRTSTSSSSPSARSSRPIRSSPSASRPSPCSDGSDKSVRVAAESSWLAYQCRHHGVAMVHHAGGVVPAVRSVPGLFDRPRPAAPPAPRELRPGQARRSAGPSCPRSARSARLAVTPSESSRQPCCRVVDLPPEHVWIVPHGVPDAIGRAGREVDLRRSRPRFGSAALLRLPRHHLSPQEPPHAGPGLRPGGEEHPEASLVLTGGDGPIEGEVRRDDRRARSRGPGPPPRPDPLGGPRRPPAPGPRPRCSRPASRASAPRCSRPWRRGRPVIAADATALPEVVGGRGRAGRARRRGGVGRRVAPACSTTSEHHARAGRGRPRTGPAVQRRGVGRAPCSAAYREAAGVGLVNLLVLCPHFAPDVAPTGEVMTSVVEELVGRGHRLHVVTALPWYQHHRVEPGWDGRLVRTETTDWGRITRVHPFPTDKTNIPARRSPSAGSPCWPRLAAAASAGPGPTSCWPCRRRSPSASPAGRWPSARRVPFVFNIQDVFPDVAVEPGRITRSPGHRRRAGLERFLYRRSDAVTVLSEDLARQRRGQARAGGREAARSR